MNFDSLKFYFLLIFLCIGCVNKSINNSSSNATGKNNVIKETKIGKVTENGGQDKIIIEGTNNIFDVIKNNASYFDNLKDVIIIKGNGNIIKLYNTNIVDMRKQGNDTIVFEGNNARYVMSLSDNIVTERGGNHIDTVQMIDKPFDVEKLKKDFPIGNEKAGSIGDLINRIQKGDWEAFYELGDIYLFGLGRNEISSQKAIELYEYGVIKKEIKSIRKLGDIWFNGTDDIEKDRIKAKYFYSLGAQLGDKYCIDMLDW